MSQLQKDNDVANQTHDALAAALAELRRAISRRKVDPICSAYLALHNAAKGMKLRELLERAEQAVGRPVINLVVSAFSHRRCFMCEGGVIPCEQCGGSGSVGKGRRCQQCEGLGFSTCSFCRGTGWFDRESIPPEIRPAVLDRQLAHVHRALYRLNDAMDKIKDNQIRPLPLKDRRELIQWLMRLHSRAIDLIEADAVGNAQEQTKLAVLASRIDAAIDLSR